MQNKYFHIIENKGGKVLQKRTKVKGIKLGDTFTFQNNTASIFKIALFFKDKMFNTCPMVLGINEKENGTILCSVGFVNILKEDNIRIKRKRRN